MKLHFFALSIFCIAAGSSLYAVDFSAPGPFAVETLEFADLPDSTRAGHADLETDRPRFFPRRFRQTVSPAVRSVPIKVHAPAGAGRFPVVIVSHGAGGDWDTHYAQARHLASHGYAVLCLEHVGSNRDDITKGMRIMKNLEAMTHDSNEVLTRPKDVSFAIECARKWNQTHPKLRSKMDLLHVGVMGHSFGAFTTMVVCGMRPVLNWLTPPVPPGKGLGPDLHDARVRCGVALSPQGVGEPFFLRESFDSLKVPLLGITGSLDKQQNGLPAENRRDGFALWPAGGHCFMWLENARHADFTDSTGASQRGIPSPTRAQMQPIVRAATLIFFNTHLKGDGDAGTQLTDTALDPYLRGSVNRVEVSTK
jgi:predicted dienelactone hydrolase